MLVPPEPNRISDTYNHPVAGVFLPALRHWEYMERDSSGARRPATSNDVARLAGGSQGPGSYVRTDTPGKGSTARTRARVLDAPARLGSVPSASAQSPRSGQSNLLLIPVPLIPVGQAFIAFLNH